MLPRKKVWDVPLCKIKEIDYRSSLINLACIASENGKGEGSKKVGEKMLDNWPPTDHKYLDVLLVFFYKRNG